jgi:hypothetical protein
VLANPWSRCESGEDIPFVLLVFFILLLNNTTMKPTLCYDLEPKMGGKEEMDILSPRLQRGTSDALKKAEMNSFIKRIKKVLGSS